MEPGGGDLADVPRGFGLFDCQLQGGRTGLVVTGLPLRASKAGELISLGLLEAETSRDRCGATDVVDGVVEAMLDAGQFAECGVVPYVEPGVVDGVQPVLDVGERVNAARLVAGGDRCSGGEQPVGSLVPWPVQSGVEGVTAIGQRQRVAELAMMGHDVGEVVRAAC